MNITQRARESLNLKPRPVSYELNFFPLSFTIGFLGVSLLPHLAESLLGARRGAFVCLENYPAVTVRVRRGGVRRPPTRPPSHLPVAPDLKERGLGEVSACARAIVGWPPPHAWQFVLSF